MYYLYPMLIEHKCIKTFKRYSHALYLTPAASKSFPLCWKKSKIPEIKTAALSSFGDVMANSSVGPTISSIHVQLSQTQVIGGGLLNKFESAELVGLDVYKVFGIIYFGWHVVILDYLNNGKIKKKLFIINHDLMRLQHIIFKALERLVSQNSRWILNHLMFFFYHQSHVLSSALSFMINVKVVRMS